MEEGYILLIDHDFKTVKGTSDPFSRTVAVVANWHSALSTSLKSASLSMAALSTKSSFVPNNLESKLNKFNEKRSRNSYSSYQHKHILLLDQ